jgi:hypothetical protein
MDLAKIVATLLAHGGSPADYVGDDQIRGRSSVNLRTDDRRDGF